MTTTTVYGASSLQRKRRTNDELAELDDAIITAVSLDSPVTLRGVYYRVVSAGAVEKTENGYAVVGRQLLKLRRSGRVSYEDITDGTRFVHHNAGYGGVDEILRETASIYRRNLWDNQGVRVFLMSEKDAITGVVSGVTRQWCVPLGVLRGYCSESFAWMMANDIMRAERAIVYHLGDHDPSGADAWRDFREKVARFAAGADITFERLAVTPEQITSMKLPTRPTKKSDSRSHGFEGESVEVDAIPAPELRRIVDEAITQHVDQHALHVMQTYEASEKEFLLGIAQNWAVTA